MLTPRATTLILTEAVGHDRMIVARLSPSLRAVQNLGDAVEEMTLLASRAGLTPERTIG